LFSDSAELLFLSERFSQIEDGELRTENIKRRIDLMWKFVKPRPTPAKVVTASEKMQNEIKPIPQPEEKQQFSFYKKADAGSDLVEQLRQKEAMRAELADTVSKTMAKYK
tara:strand:+ start:237 stop:566 length:330 start_codon:yes stop_codon:yes gene_type:complete